MYDPKSRLCAAIHAGWKGALFNIIDETIRVMKEKGAHSQNILAAIGPCIQQQCYETQEDLYLYFKKANSHWVKFFKKNENKKGYLFDLPGLIKSQLNHCEVEKVDNLCLNTYEEEENFFSCRRAYHKGEKFFGNQASAICLTDFNP
jgi:YfiH family protein